MVHQFATLLQVLAATGYMEPLTCATVGWASRTVNSKLQMALLDQSKTVVESMQNLLVAAKDAGGNRKVIICRKLFFLNSHAVSWPFISF